MDEHVAKKQFTWVFIVCFVYTVTSENNTYELKAGGVLCLRAFRLILRSCSEAKCHQHFKRLRWEAHDSGAGNFKHLSIWKIEALTESFS